MKFDWEIKFGDLLQIILILATLIGGGIALTTWKTEVSDHIEAIKIQQQSDTADHKELQKSLSNINTRLSRIEGKLNVTDGSGGQP